MSLERRFFEHCFATSEVPRRSPELKIRRFEPQKRDLQFGSGPRPSNKQESCFFNDFHVFVLHFMAFLKMRFNGNLKMEF